MVRPVLVLALVLLQATAAAPRFDSGRAWDHLRALVALGPRPSGSPAIDQTRQYIKTQLAQLNVPVREQAWDDTTPAGRLHMVNLIATIPGASQERIVIAGHFDTKRYREFRFVGASDGGSSAAFLLEMARVLKHAGIRSRSSSCSSMARRRLASGSFRTTRTAAGTTCRSRSRTARSPH